MQAAQEFQDFRLKNSCFAYLIGCIYKLKFQASECDVIFSLDPPSEVQFWMWAMGDHEIQSLHPK